MTTANQTENTGFVPAPSNAVIDHKVVKKLAGEALAKIDGVLDLKGGFADMLKDENDPTRGLDVNVTDDNQATVCAKIVTEAGKNIPQIVNQATQAITDVLQNTAGLTVKAVTVEVADTMSREDYEEKNKTQTYNYSGLAGF